MTERVRVIVAPDGSMRTVYADSAAPLLAAVGAVRISRASHVEPGGGGWVADLSPVAGPSLGPFPTRAEALAAELSWLHSRDIPVPRGAATSCD